MISRCIQTLSELNDRKLLRPLDLSDLLKLTLPHLLHPNLWVRQAAAGAVASAAKGMSQIDVAVKLTALLEPYVERQVVQADKTEVVLRALKVREEVRNDCL